MEPASTGFCRNKARGLTRGVPWVSKQPYRPRALSMCKRLANFRGIWCELKAENVSITIQARCSASQWSLNWLFSHMSTSWSCEIIPWVEGKKRFRWFEFQNVFHQFSIRIEWKCAHDLLCNEVFFSLFIISHSSLPFLAFLSSVCESNSCEISKEIFLRAEERRAFANKEKSLPKNLCANFGHDFN